VKLWVGIVETRGAAGWKTAAEDEENEEAAEAGETKAEVDADGEGGDGSTCTRRSREKQPMINIENHHGTSTGLNCLAWVEPTTIETGGGGGREVLVTGGADGTMRVLSVVVAADEDSAADEDTNEEVDVVSVVSLAGHDSIVHTIAAMPFESAYGAVSTSFDGTVRVWDFGGGGRCGSSGGGSGGVGNSSDSGSGDCGGGGRYVDGKAAVSVLVGHAGQTYDVCSWGGDNPALVLSCSYDKTVRLWDLRAPGGGGEGGQAGQSDDTNAACAVFRGHGGPSWQVQRVRGGGVVDGMFVSSSSDGTAIVWDARRAGGSNGGRFGGGGSSSSSSNSSSSGGGGGGTSQCAAIVHVLVPEVNAGTEGGRGESWGEEHGHGHETTNTPSGPAVVDTNAGCTNTLTILPPSAQSSGGGGEGGAPLMVASGFDDGSIRFWDIATGRQLHCRKSHHSAWCYVPERGASLCSDIGKYVVGTSDGTVVTYGIGDGCAAATRNAAVRTASHMGGTTTVSDHNGATLVPLGSYVCQESIRILAACGDVVVTGSNDGTLMVDSFA
jgi:WD40 repeat protein